MTDTASADPAKILADLEARLRATPRAARPLEHAALRHAIGMAYAELPTGDRRLNLSRAIGSYRQAAALFGPHRWPTEHARVQSALGAALRELGDAQAAVDACARAVELLTSGEAPGDLGAALNNLGLARSDLGQHEEAIDALSRSVEVFTASGEPRQQVMALHNLGQVQAAAGDHAAAVESYQRGAASVNQEDLPYQWGLLRHAEGVSHSALGDSQRAVEAFQAALGVFSRQSYPFPHALAKNNLGLAYAQAGDVTSLRRALASYSDALRVFDPRMHREQWEQSYRNMEMVESALAEADEQRTRTEHFAILLSEVDHAERHLLLRRRLMDNLALPDRQRDEALAELDVATLQLDEDAARTITAAWLDVLMELPDEMLMAGLQARMAAHEHLPTDEEREAAAQLLEYAISNELLAPQRIRVRDTLETMGYERP